MGDAAKTGAKIILSGLAAGGSLVGGAHDPQKASTLNDQAATTQEHVQDQREEKAASDTESHEQERNIPAETTPKEEPKEDAKADNPSEDDDDD